MRHPFRKLQAGCSPPNIQFEKSSEHAPYDLMLLCQPSLDNELRILQHPCMRSRLSRLCASADSMVRSNRGSLRPSFNPLQAALVIAAHHLHGVACQSSASLRLDAKEYLDRRVQKGMLPNEVLDPIPGQCRETSSNFSDAPTAAEVRFAVLTVNVQIGDSRLPAWFVYGWQMAGQRYQWQDCMAGAN